MTIKALQSSLRERRIHVIQGEFVVADDPDVVLTTVLGSCVAACIRDAKAKVGGMNHFLLPGDGWETDGQQATRYGIHAMELLVNALLSCGAQRSRLEAKLFGGANVLVGGSDIGALNASFAEDFLRYEGLSFVGGSLRGQGARRIQYWPVSGRARQIILGRADPPPTPPASRQASLPSDGNDVELF